jgi:hypothetical protein
LGLGLELELPLPMARWISFSTVVAALLLSFAALPLTAWIWVRLFRVVGDCRRRSVREGGGGGAAFKVEDGVVGRGEAGVLLPDGVECAMYDFEALVIALVRRVVVPEMAWLECECECQQESFKGKGKKAKAISNGRKDVT